MIPLRKSFELREGVRVDTLFTPHLYSFRGVSGVSFELRDDTSIAVLELYADIIYCAALNAWVLDGHGPVEDFPHRRGDFHEWMTASPKEFSEVMSFAVEAFTGKPLKKFAKSKESKIEEEEGGKKKRFSLFGKKSRSSLSAPAGSPKSRRRGRAGTSTGSGSKGTGNG